METRGNANRLIAFPPRGHRAGEQIFLFDVPVQDAT